MNEKIAVSDILKETNGAVTALTYAIEHSNNLQFRNSMISAREKFTDLQWDMYTIAKEKQYYIPGAPAGQADIDQVKQTISQ